MSKRPTDVDIPPAKKRGNDRQLTKDDFDEEEDEVEEEAGQWKKAPTEVINQRRILKARRGAAAPQPIAGAVDTTAAAAPKASNPFAGFTLMTPTETAQVKAEVEPATENPATASNGEEFSVPAEGDGTVKPEANSETVEAGVAGENPEKQEDTKQKPAEDAAASGGSNLFTTFATSTTSGFASLASQPTASFGTGTLNFSGTTGGFGGLASLSASTGAAFGSSSASTSAAEGSFSFTPGFTGFNTSGTTFPAVSSVFGTAAATGGALFGASMPSTGTASISKPAPAVQLTDEVPVTGEEDETTMFSGEGALFEFNAEKTWKERGKGPMKVNITPSTGQARLVMRQKGNLRLLLNANLWPEMMITKMEGGKGVTFACINHASSSEEVEKEEDKKLSTYAFRVKMPEVLEQFVAAVDAHKAAAKKGEHTEGTEDAGADEKV